MKSDDWGPAIAFALLAAGVVILMRKNDGSPVPLSALIASGTADELGLDNAFPDRLLPRARGLAVVVGALRGAGFRVISMYRTPLVQAAVDAKNAHPDQTPDLSQLPLGKGDHTEMVGLDIGSDASDHREVAGLLATDRRLRQQPLLVAVLRSTLVEVDHVHCSLRGDALVALGETANRA